MIWKSPVEDSKSRSVEELPSLIEGMDRLGRERLANVLARMYLHYLEGVEKETTSSSLERRPQHRAMRASDDKRVP
jgi:hypothetical protein